MRTYAKVFGDIRQSSIWAEDSDTRIVWITMLTMSDQHGMVRATAPGISHEARVPLAKTREALTLLESPDPESRTLEHDGRRIERVDGGYLILNYLKYRDLQTIEKNREQTKARVQAYRQRHATVTGRNGSVTQCNAPVTPGNACNAILDTDTDTDTDTDPSPPIIPPPTPGQHNTDFDVFWQAYPRKVGKEAARKAWKTHKPNIDNILQALEWQTKQDQWLKDGGQYIPHPATYLNQGRWQDAQPQALTNNPQKPFSAANPDDPEFRRRVNDYLSGNPHQSYSEAVDVIRQTDPSYRRPPLKVRIAEYRAQHPDASYLDAIERVGSPAEVADYMQHLRAQAASSREPGQVESVAGVLESLGVKLPPSGT